MNMKPILIIEKQLFNCGEDTFFAKLTQDSDIPQGKPN